MEEKQRENSVSVSMHWRSELAEKLQSEFGEFVASDTDTQNGLDDPSTWFEISSKLDSEDVKDRLRDIGFELFNAPKDDGEQLFSTYGIPVDSLENVKSGDYLVLDKSNVVKVYAVNRNPDRDLWNDTETVVRVTKQTSFKTKRTLVETDSGEIEQYREKTSDGETEFTRMGSIETVHRDPRESEIQ